MITKMKKYTFLIMSSAYEQFLLTLREAGVVHVTQKANGLADNAELQATMDRAEEKLPHKATRSASLRNATRRASTSALSRKS